MILNLKTEIERERQKKTLRLKSCSILIAGALASVRTQTPFIIISRLTFEFYFSCLFFAISSTLPLLCGTKTFADRLRWLSPGFQSTSALSMCCLNRLLFWFEKKTKRVSERNSKIMRRKR